MNVGVECWWGLRDAVMSASTRSILVTAVSGTKEHPTSVTSKENCQPEYSVLRARTASFKKLLLQLTWTGCRHSTLRWGLWAVCEALDHTTDALQCKHVPCSLRRLVYVLDHMWRIQQFEDVEDKGMLGRLFGWQCMASW